MTMADEWTTVHEYLPDGAIPLNGVRIATFVTDEGKRTFAYKIDTNGRELDFEDGLQIASMLTLVRNMLLKHFGGSFEHDE